MSLGKNIKYGLKGDLKGKFNNHMRTIKNFQGKGPVQEKEKATAEALAAEQRALQMTQLAELDSEENRRIKKLLAGSRGTRNYRGGPMFRGRAENKAGSAPRTAAGASSAAPSAGALRAGGARGGMARLLQRSLIP